jgi:hypothetical protein
MMTWFLSRRVGGLGLRAEVRPMVVMTVSALVMGGVCLAVQRLPLYPTGDGKAASLLQLLILMAVGAAVYAVASVAQVVQCAQACINTAGRTSVDVVYLTGGSSALRPLVEALRAAMPQAQLVEGNRFGGVAAGLAHAGAAVGG